MKNRKSAPQKWKIAKLKEHPQQAAVFGDISDVELAALADSLRKYGLRDPVEILPDGTVVAGHQRVRAAKLLGWAEVNVVVRHDLAAAGPEAIEAYLIDDNLSRRQLSPLGLARCIQRMVEIELHCRAGDLRWEKKEALMKKIGDRLNMSPRNASRYLLVLKAPAAVQQAFDRREIQLKTAGKVALLSRRDQEAVALKIDKGEKAADVVAAHLPRGRQDGRDVGRSVGRLLRSLRREVPQLAGRLDKTKPQWFSRNLEVLRAADDLLGKLIERAGEA